MRLAQGLRPRTLRALALVAELVYGTPASTRDPARFAFAHGGKDRTIETMNAALSGVARGDRAAALKRLSRLAPVA